MNITLTNDNTLLFISSILDTFVFSHNDLSVSKVNNKINLFINGDFIRMEEKHKFNKTLIKYSNQINTGLFNYISSIID